MKHLINLFLLLALLIPIEALAADSTTPMVAVGEEEPMDFSNYSSTSYPDLSAATSITVTGTWTDAQVTALKYALKNSTDATTNNDKLLSVDMSGMELSGNITSGFENFFRNNTVLTDVILPQGVTTGTVSFYNTFRGCKVLTTITNLDKFTGVNNFYATFDSCSLLKEVTLAGVTNTKTVSFYRAFFGCTALETITGLNKLTTVNSFYQAFRNCSSLKEVKFTEVTNTEVISFYNAFYGCTALTTITNLEKFTGISSLERAFSDCSSLTSVSLGNVPTGSTNLSSAFTNTNPNCLKYLPSGDNTTAALEGSWNTFTNFIIDGTTHNNIVLTDEKPFHCPTAFTVPADQTITYTRDFTGNLATPRNGWNTLCLPFEAEMRIYGEAGTAAAKIPFAGNDDTKGEFWLKPFAGGEGETVRFTHTTDGTAIQANTPYLIALPGEEFGAASMHLNPVMEFTASGITVPATPDASGLSHAPEGSDFAYVGNYVSLRSEDIYILLRGEGEESDVFACPPSGVETGVLSFRAYIKEVTEDGSANGARMLSIMNEDGTTSLNSPTPALPEGEGTGREADKAYKIMTPDGLRIVKGDRWYTIEGRSLTPTLSEREGAGR